MIYAMLIIYILLYSYMVKVKEKKLEFVVYFIPIGTLLIMILSLQNDVGTDYYSYLSLAEGSTGLRWIESKSEYLFVYLVNLVRMIGIPQLIFVVTAIIQVFFVMLITYEVKKWIGYTI